MNVIACIVADNTGNKLWIKDFREDKGRLFLKYRSTYNDIPFTETEVFIVDDGLNCVITGEDGTVLYRFGVKWLEKIKP
jgi:hypothetical protein